MTTTRATMLPKPKPKPTLPHDDYDDDDCGAACGGG